MWSWIKPQTTVKKLAPEVPDTSELNGTSAMPEPQATGGPAINVPSLVAALSSHAEGLDENERYILAEQLSTAVYPHFKFSEFGRVWLDDDDFFVNYKRFMDPNNWHSADRKFAMRSLVKAATRLPGDFAECGVYNGGSAIYMSEQAAASGKHLHLFDSFEGLSEPGELDGSYWTKGGLAYGQEKVEENLSEFAGHFTCYRGWIPDRFEEVGDKTFSFLHVDVDLHEPTSDTIAFFYPRMTAGGFILLDDHGFSSCPGARGAAEEFFSEKPEAIIDLPTGQGLVVCH